MTTQTLQKIGFQHVGSFLRPESLKQARQSFAAGNITAEELEGVENAAITELVNKEVEAGLDVVTDGEFRRSYWHLDNFWGFDGVERFNYGEGYFFAHEETRDDSARLTGKLALADEAGVAAKITIPSPSQFYGELSRGVNVERIAEYYDSNEELFEDIKRVYHEEILALYNAGARTVQLDDCTWGLLVDPKFKDVYAATGFDINDLKRLYLDLNNGAIADLPDDLTINTHVCRGNYHSDWATSGGYDDVADELFGQENVTNYFSNMILNARVALHRCKSIWRQAVAPATHTATGWAADQAAGSLVMTSGQPISAVLAALMAVLVGNWLTGKTPLDMMLVPFGAVLAGTFFGLATASVTTPFLNWVSESLASTMKINPFLSLSKTKALALLSSDALSSVAYGTESITTALLAAGAVALWLQVPIALLVLVLLAAIVMSYRQIIHAYPSGGGAYAVASENWGSKAV
ncbi:hypothetical protein Pfo_031249 [Paulownia fortunei]|nr:hypothetical protein Pfo_031249 [Paulownia fortunei]